MSFRRFWITLGFSLIFLAGWWAAGWVEELEEPLATIVIPDGFDIPLDETAPASATSVGVNYRRPPDSGGDDEFETTVGANQIVSDPQLFPTHLIGRSETSIAVDDDEGVPGENIVIGWNDADGFLAAFALDGLSGWAFSGNSGASFVDGGGLPNTTIPTSPPTIIVPSGDPWLALLRDELGNGTFLYANLAVRANVDGNGPGTGRTVEGLSIHRGTVAGGALSWATPTLIPSPSPPGTFGLDKEAMTVKPKGPEQEVYVSATNFDFAAGPSGNPIVVFSSHDGGATFSGPVFVQGQGKDGVQGSMPAVGVNGDVFVVWERGRFNFPKPAKIQFARSTDQGATFGTQVDVALITPASEKPPAGYNRSRYNDFPRISVAQSGPWEGRIYVAYHDVGNNPDLPGTVLFDPAGPQPAVASGVADADVFIKFSDDGGATWSAPINVNGAIGDGKVQFWPVVTATEGGTVCVVYYEDVEANLTPNPNDFETIRGVGVGTRFSTQSTLVNTFTAISVDGGATFGTPVKITDFTSNWSRTVSSIRPNYGDYIDAASREIGPNTVRVYAAWADGRELVDIDPGPGVNMRPVPSAAYGFVDITKTEGLGKLVASVPKNFVLGQNYPNPFNPTTQIDYALPAAARVELKVYNLLGQEVKTLVNHEQPAGTHQIVWDGTDASGNSVSSGIYFYQLKTPTFMETKKMMFVK